MDRMKGSYFDRLLGAALCVSQLITCAQLFSVIEQIQGITWKEPFLSFLQFFGILSLQTLVESVKTVGCVARITSEMEFLIRTLLVPLLFTIGPVFAHLVMVKLHLAQGSGGLVKTFGFLMQLFFISLCSSFVEPFRCNVHPNGFADHANCPRRFLQLFRYPLDLVLDERPYMSSSSDLSGPLHVGLVGGSARQNSGSRCAICAGLLFLDPAIQTRIWGLYHCFLDEKSLVRAGPHDAGCQLACDGKFVGSSGCVSGILETMAIRAVDPSGCANELGLASSLARGCNDF